MNSLIIAGLYSRALVLIEQNALQRQDILMYSEIAGSSGTHDLCLVSRVFCFVLFSIQSIQIAMNLFVSLPWK